MSCYLKGNSALPLINDKVKVLKSCVKNNMDLNRCGSKLVEPRHLLLTMSLFNNWHTIVLTGVIMKPPKVINNILVECNFNLKPPIQMKVWLINIYIQ